MAATLMEGVREDVELIIYNFVKQKSYNFASFVEVWKELQFQYIYCGRPTVWEMKNFTRELLLLSKSHTLSNYTTWERSGAVFLLYALYFTQPLSQHVPIRIEQAEWDQLCKFAEDMKSVNIEVSFCIYKLIANHAFDFVYSNKPYTVEATREDDLPKKENISKPQKRYKYDKFAMGSLLTSIGFDPNASAQREARYNDIKQKLNEKFPELCNFEIRRFAVNLLVPSTDSTDEPPTQESPESPIKKKPSSRLTSSQRKIKICGIPILSDDEAEPSTSGTSMPLIHESEETEPDDESDDDEDWNLKSHGTSGTSKKKKGKTLKGISRTKRSLSTYDDAKPSTSGLSLPIPHQHDKADD